MGLSRRIKHKFKFTRKYNTNVYDFFTKKKSTRKVFEEKYLINFLAVEAESLKIRLSTLIQKVWFATYRRLNAGLKKKKALKTNIFYIRKKASYLLLISFYAYKKLKQQRDIFLFLQKKNVLFKFNAHNFFCYPPFSKSFLHFWFFFNIITLNQLNSQKTGLGILAKITKPSLFLGELKNFLILHHVSLAKRKKSNFFLAKQNNVTTQKPVFVRSRATLGLIKTRAVSNKLQNVFLLKKRKFTLFCNKLCKDRKLFSFLPFVQKKKIITFAGSNVTFGKFDRAKTWASLRVVNKNFRFLFFIPESKKAKYKKTSSFATYKYEAFETAWFFYDLLQTFFLYEKLKPKIFSAYKHAFVVIFPFFSFKMQSFLLKTFFKTKVYPDFKYNQRAPRVFEYFFTRLQQKYGFRNMDVPFRLDVPLPRYKIKKQTEKVEMYKLLKITRRNYGHLTQKFFWKIRKKVYNKTKGYAFFNQLLFYESRLDIFLIRARLCDSLQDSRGFISKGWICVNGRQIYNLNYVVTLMDIVSIFSDKMLIFKHFFLNKCLQLINEYSTTIGKIFPKYLEANYLRMAFCYVPKVFSVEKIPGQFSLNKTMVTNWGKFAY